MKLTGKTQKQIDKELYEQKIKQEEQELLKYLSDTDWYMIRFTEKWILVPDDVLLKRDEARARISDIRKEMEITDADTRDTII